MIEFLNRIFGRQNSGATAKERLRLVLMSDHLSLAPEMIDAMKRDLVDVISRYVEVDREKIDVHFEHEAHGLAMLANIPITGVNRNNGNGSGGNGTIEEQGNECHAEPVEARPGAPSHGEPVEPRPSHGEPVEPRPSAVEVSTGQRRRKRRKGGQQHHGGTAPQTGSPAPAT